MWNTNQDNGREWLGQRRVKSHFRLGFEGVFEELRFEQRPKCKGGICPEKTREESSKWREYAWKTRAGTSLARWPMGTWKDTQHQ